MVVGGGGMGGVDLKPESRLRRHGRLRITWVDGSVTDGGEVYLPCNRREGECERCLKTQTIKTHGRSEGLDEQTLGKNQKKIGDRSGVWGGRV